MLKWRYNIVFQLIISMIGLIVSPYYTIQYYAYTINPTWIYHFNIQSLNPLFEAIITPQYLRDGQLKSLILILGEKSKVKNLVV